MACLARECLQAHAGVNGLRSEKKENLYIRNILFFLYFYFFFINRDDIEIKNNIDLGF